MRFIPSEIPGVILIEPDVHEDARGFFFENYHKDVFAAHGISKEFIQDNHSRSSRGTLRGLHTQISPKKQAKLVRVVRGEAYDVAVDIRPASRTFGKFVAVTLSEQNKKMLYIPDGFAHGFLSLKDNTEILYKVSEFYSPDTERGIRWDDKALAIPWPKLDIEFNVSEKDRHLPCLDDIRR